MEKSSLYFVLALFIACLYFALPNFLSQDLKDQYSSYLPNTKINLGLDLRGGAQLLLEVQYLEYLKDYYTNIENDIRYEFRKNKIAYKKISLTSIEEGIHVTLYNESDERAAKSILESDLDKHVGIKQLDSKNFVAVIQNNSHDKLLNAVITQSIEIIRKRVDENGTKEPIIQKQGDSKILLQMPGVKDSEEIKKRIGKTAKLSLHFLKNSESISYRKLFDENKTPYFVERYPVITGEMISGASGSFANGMPVVSFRLNAVGAKKFSNATIDNIGRQLAIVLDNRVLSAPVIQEPITGGQGQISGNFTSKETSELALLLRSGSLPAPLVIVEERSVGPTLGSDSIESGTKSVIWATILVAIIMIFLYRFYGIYTNIAFIYNIVIISGTMSLLGATLTLPGIAGLVLTMGMSVDANVLILERIREEIKMRKNILESIEYGFRGAFNGIIDSNVTTLLIALVLLLFGTGTIRGFATTLSIGIIGSLISAFFLTKLQLVMHESIKARN